MKYGLYDVSYGPGAAPFVGGRNLAGLSPLTQHSAYCVSVILTLAARRDNGDDIGLQALERLGARFSPTRAETIARAMRTELTEAHAWIAATQAERLDSIVADTASDGGASADKQREVEQSLERQHGPVDDVALASESIARQLERTGETGKGLATELREANRQRMQQYREGSIQAPAVLRAWMPNDCGESPILVALAEAIWKDRVKQRRRLEHNGYRGHCKIAKHAGGLFSWACGAPAVEIDGQRYGITPNPGARIFGPRTLQLLPRGLNLKIAHQASLPIDFDTDDTEEGVLALALVNPCQVALTPAGTKIALQILTDSHVMVSAGVATISAKDLAREIHGGQKYQRRMLAPTAMGVTSLRSLMLYMPDGTRMQVFDVRDAPNPQAVTEETTFALAITRNFEAAVRPLYLGRGDGSWNGTFLLDVSGAMAIPMHQPEMLRLHVWGSVQANAAYKFGSGSYHPERHPYLSLDDIAARVNTYDRETAGLLAANGKLGRGNGWKQRKRSEQRGKLKGYLDKLSKMQLWRLEEKGKRFRLSPTDAYIEAWKKIRDGGSGHG